MGYITKETYKKQEDGTFLVVLSEEVWVDEPTQEELIAEKEAELLKMYAELNALKSGL